VQEAKHLGEGLLVIKLLVIGKIGLVSLSTCLPAVALAQAGCPSALPRRDL